MRINMPAWTGEIDGALGAFFWIAPGPPDECLGPIVPALFVQYRDNARERALLMGRDPSTTLLAWVPVGDVVDELNDPEARLLGRLPEIRKWSQCLRWAEAERERAALARCLAPSVTKERLRL